MTQKRIPIHGSMTRPNHPDEGIEELKNGILDWHGDEIEITYSTDEFTSVCPTTQQPDFNKISILYVPNKKYIESKTMKFYLWSFRDFGIHCEYLADTISRDIMEVTDAKFVQVVVDQKPRGGIALKAVSHKHGKKTL